MLNTLPEILRQPHPHRTLFRRQGPQFSLKLDKAMRSTMYSTISTDRSHNHTATMDKTALRINRYSVDRRQRRASSRRGLLSSIGYDHLSDKDFQGTRGKQDQVESLQVLLGERQQHADVTALKVASCRGFAEEYRLELAGIGERCMADLQQVEQEVKGQILVLRELLSTLRRETRAELKAFNQEGKELNDELIEVCEQFKATEQHCERVAESLQRCE